MKRQNPASSRLGASSDRLCDILGTERPVILAPMANVGGGTLAAAVSDAGGFGILGGGYGDLAWIDQQLLVSGDSRIGIGLITWNMVDGALAAVLAHQPPAVWLSFGDPTAHIGSIHEAGALAICQVGTVAEAVSASAAGADVIVAQGSEAGGHSRVGRSLFGLLPAISAALPDTPLVAAGGINDQAGLDAAHCLGAAGVALGTAFYATLEALDVDLAKQRLVASTGDDTVQSRVYDHVRGPVWPQGYTGRTIRTRLTDKWAGREGELAMVIGPIQHEHQKAVAESDMSIRVVFAGEGLDAVDSIRPAAEVAQRFHAVRSTP